MAAVEGREKGEGPSKESGLATEGAMLKEAKERGEEGKEGGEARSATEEGA